jgi:hypothetical protein
MNFRTSSRWRHHGVLAKHSLRRPPQPWQRQFFPVETSQLPLFRLLGTPEKDKRHVIYETGHAVPRKEFIREGLDWLDKYLGPVKR